MRIQTDGSDKAQALANVPAPATTNANAKLSSIPPHMLNGSNEPNGLSTPPRKIAATHMINSN